MTRVSVFMPSFNKPGYVVQGIKSVTDQTSPDWELWIMDNSTDGYTWPVIAAYEDTRIHQVHIDLTPEERQYKDAPVYLCNQYYPKANGDIIIYMSDDDLLSPELVDRVVREFDEHPDYAAVYWNSFLVSVHSPDEKFEAVPWLMATVERSFGQLDCQIDGGQIAVKKRAFERLEKPWYPEDLSLMQNNHSDGILMQKLAVSGVVFHPVDYDGLTHRRTPISVYTKA